MPKFYVEMAQLVRQVKIIVVEAPSIDDLDEDVLSTVYEKYEDDGRNWKMDDSWGSEEGSHSVVGAVENDPSVDTIVDIVVDENYNVTQGKK